MDDVRDYGAEFDLHETVQTFNVWVGHSLFRIEIQKSLSRSSGPSQPFSPRCWIQMELPGSERFEIPPGAMYHQGYPWDVWVHTSIQSEQAWFATAESALETALADLPKPANFK